jgi:hypothetical protein
LANSHNSRSNPSSRNNLLMNSSSCEDVLSKEGSELGKSVNSSLAGNSPLSVICLVELPSIFGKELRQSNNVQRPKRSKMLISLKLRPGELKERVQLNEKCSSELHNWAQELT